MISMFAQMRKQRAKVPFSCTWLMIKEKGTNVAIGFEYKCIDYRPVIFGICSCSSYFVIIKKRKKKR